jgi:thioredoxin-related protein
MRPLISIFLSLVLASGALAQEKPLPSSKIMKQAFKEASKEKKDVIVIFHASWCGWCKRMDSIMNMPELKYMFDRNYVIRHLVVLESKDKKNLENPGAAEMMEKYNGKGSGIPFWLIFDAKGNLLADSRMPTVNKKTGKEELANTGCPAQPDEVEFFKGVIRKTSNLNDEQLSLIADKFLLKRTITH